ncbi:MAG: ATP-dependent RNA helicase HrpA [Fibrobacterales bacterium]
MQAPNLSFDPQTVPCSYIPRLIGLQLKAKKDSKAIESFVKLLNEAQTLLSKKAERPLELTYPPLPVSEKREDIMALIRDNQICIIQGDTGSGKTTQIPKMCMELGLGFRGVIGCTQPRRIAALSIADRLREETGENDLIGHKIRFLEQAPDSLHVKVMTDGILLQEFKTDRFLNQYSCIILDEAHERSLNIDILLGILKPLLKKRRDLKLIITSATIDAEHFSQYFDKAPILEVDGRMFPVTVDYWDTDEIAEEYELESYSMTDATIDAIKHVQNQGPDHLLCFLPTEKDIHEVEKGLDSISKDFLILPLFGRLSPQEQKRIFAPSNKPKIVLSTNIAETSLTIPGIAYVIDTGYARVSRFCSQSHIQGLPIEKISQASANQRKGRAGRVKPGTCIRLYSEENFLSRPEYTEPEILRSNLANVLIQLMNTGINPHQFQFLSQPPQRTVTAGFKLLWDLGAITDITDKGQLTPVGKELSTIPVDVTVAKILITAKKKNVLTEVLAIAAGISIQDPRLRPSDDRERSKADGLHSRFKDKKSDFVSLLKLWDFINQNWGKGESLNKLRRLCSENYLHFLRIREWRDLFEQFSRILKLKIELGKESATNVHHDSLHQSILSGFLHNVAERHPEGYGYKIAKHNEAFIFPGSGIFNKKPQWIVASEVRETSRVYLVGCTQIEPEWLLEFTKHICSYTYFNVVWNQERGFVEAREKIMFKGFCISFGRKVNYESIDPAECCEIFWREGVVLNPRQSFGFKKLNNRVLKELEELEKKSRTFGLVPSEEQVIAWFIQNFPDITSLHKLKKYIQEHGEKAFCFDAETWLNNQIEALPERSRVAVSQAKNLDKNYPSDITFGNEKSSIKYQFDFGTDLDGACVRIVPNQVSHITPGLMFKKIPGWGQWIFNATFDSFKKPIADQLSPKREELYYEWAKAIEADPHNSIASLLFKTINKGRPLDETISLPSKWENFVTIHFRVKASNKQLPLDLSPSDTVDTLAEKAFHTFYLTHWFEDRGKSFAFRTFKCYNQLPPPITVLQTTILPYAIESKEHTYSLAYSSLDMWLSQCTTEGTFQLLYHKKFKIGSEHIQGCRKVLGDRINAIASQFNLSAPIISGLIDWQVWLTLKEVNLAKVSAQECVQGIAATLPLPKAHVGAKKKLKSLSNLKSASSSIDSDSAQLIIDTLVISLALEPEQFSEYFSFITNKCNGKDFSDFSTLIESKPSLPLGEPNHATLAVLSAISTKVGLDTIVSKLPQPIASVSDLSTYLSQHRDNQKRVIEGAKKRRDAIYSLFSDYGLTNVVLSSDIKKALHSLEERGNSPEQLMAKEISLNGELNKALNSFFQKPHAFSEEFGQAESVEQSSLASLRASFGRIK